jgi:hypothetical protein
MIANHERGFLARSAAALSVSLFGSPSATYAQTMTTSGTDAAAVAAGAPST